MKALAWSFVSVTFISLTLNTACGSKDDDKEETAVTSSYTYSDTKVIIDQNCATSECHKTGNPAKNTALDTLAGIKLSASEMAKRIKATDGSVMPKDDLAWKNTAEAKILLDWLAGGADLK